MTVINDHKMKIPQKWQIPLSIPISESFIEKHYFFHFFFVYKTKTNKKNDYIHMCFIFMYYIFLKTLLCS